MCGNNRLQRSRTCSINNVFKLLYRYSYNFNKVPNQNKLKLNTYVSFYILT